MKKSKTIIALILVIAAAIFSPSAAPAETYEYPNIQFLPETARGDHFTALGLDIGSNYRIVGVQGADFMNLKDVGKKHVVKLPPNTLVVISYTLRIIEMVEPVGIDNVVYEYGIAVVKK